MRIQTKRLLVTDLTPDMAPALHEGSLDDATRRFLPDEVFETEAIAQEVISDLMDCYGGTEGPFVHPMLHDGELVGYVQLCAIEDGWEVGYHVSEKHRGHGYAAEGLRAFLPEIMAQVGIDRVEGVCLAENAASIRVLEKCGFVPLFRGMGPYQDEMREIVRMRFTK